MESSVVLFLNVSALICLIHTVVLAKIGWQKHLLERGRRSYKIIFHKDNIFNFQQIMLINKAIIYINIYILTHTYESD